MGASDFAAAAARLSGVASVVLGWSPDTFWHATPVELTHVLAVLANDAASAPPAPADLVSLMEMHPDG